MNPLFKSNNLIIRYAMRLEKFSAMINYLKVFDYFSWEIFNFFLTGKLLNSHVFSANNDHFSDKKYEFDEYFGHHSPLLYFSDLKIISCLY